VEDRFAVVVRGPKAIQGAARVLVPRQPAKILITPEQAITSAWDAESSTILLSFNNKADDVTVGLEW
jgi:hypothetical protein